MPSVAPFAYMQWAKRHAGARLHLGMSGLGPPPPGLMPETLSLDLQPGADMPPEPRRRIAERYGAAEDEVMLTLGTSHALYLLCASQLGPGDRCLVERPCYEVLRRLPGLFGAELGRFERRLEHGYRLPLELVEQVRAERPRMVIVSNPHNPSGALLDVHELAPLADAVKEVGGVLVVDEVYLEYLPDAPARSARQLGAAVASSLTKAYGFGTARFGWLLAPRPVVARALTYNDYVSVLYPTPAAAVGLAVLERLPALQARAHAIAERGRARFAAWAASRHDVEWHPSEAGVMAFPRLLRLTDTGPFCERLAREHDTLIVPGGFFEAPSHVRIGFGGDESALEEGLARIGSALDAR